MVYFTGILLHLRLKSVIIAGLQQTFIEKLNQLADMQRMKTHPLCIVALTAAMLMSGCLKHPDNSRFVDRGTLFDFATTQTCAIHVDYCLEGFDAGILFEVYAENPYAEVTQDEGTLPVKRDDLTPVFKGFTSEKGVFDGFMSIPTWASSVWIVTDYPVSHPCVEVSANGAVNFNLNAYVAGNIAGTKAGTKALTKAGYTLPANFYVLNDWNTQGVPQNLLHEEVPAGLLSDIRKVLINGNKLPGRGEATNYLVPDSKDANPYYPNQNIVISEDCDGAEIEFVFLASDASLLNSMAYYSYPTPKAGQSKPATAEDPSLHKTIIFPYMSGAGHPLKSGDKIKLKYWNAAANGGAGAYEDRFPAGTTIGFSLIPDGYVAKNGNIAKSSRGNMCSIIYSDASWNGQGFTINYPWQKQQSVALHTDKYELVVIGFEDLTRCVTWGYHDHDFDDAIFYVRVNPFDAIDPGDDHEDDDLDPEDPPTDPDFYTVEYKGTLAFEDLWPWKGDYDMNDVGLTYHCTVTFNLDNEVIKLTDVFIPVRKGADFNDGFGYELGVEPGVIDKAEKTIVQLNGAGPHPSLSYDISGKGLETANTEKANILLFDDIKKVVKQDDGEQMAYVKERVQVPLYKYIINTTFTSPQQLTKIGFPPYNPYTVVIHAKQADIPKVDPRNREVHLPNFPPTMLANPAWFGTQDDYSDPYQNVWYLSTQSFPFAINIPTHNFDFPLESVRIDKVYPDFAVWAASKGLDKKDWYIK